MAELSFGSLVKFLQEMNVGDQNPIHDNHTPVLLQIRSIIPVLREGNLWPNQGFLLRVADISHALYVSLPQEQDDMILCDKLHIGQYLYVEKLEAAYPVPLLKGIRPLQGRHPCLGAPKDLIPFHNLEKFLGVSKLDSTNDQIKVPIEKPVGQMGSTGNVVIEENNCMIKEKQREKSLYFSASGISSNDASSEEGTIRSGVISLMKEESNYMIKEKQDEKSQTSLSSSKGSSNDENGKTEDLSSTFEEINDKLKKKLSEKSRSSNVFRGSGSSNERVSRKSSIHRPRKSDTESVSSGYRTKRSTDIETHYKIPRKHKPRNVKDSDVESTISVSSTSPMFKRRSWGGKEATGISKDVSDTTFLKPEAKTNCCGSSVPISPAHSTRNDSSDDNSISVTKKTLTSVTTKPSKLSSKSSIPMLTKLSEDSKNETVSLSSRNDTIVSTDTDISWDFLPPSLVKLGQEVSRQRETSLLASVEALLEASAAEKLLKCLSVYSEIISGKKDDQYPSMDKFFNLQDDLSQTKLIFQSLTDPISPQEAMKIAVDRKQNAATWIKAALDCDLNPISDPSKTTGISLATSSTTPETANYSNTPKSTLLLRKQTSKHELLPEIVINMESQKNWVKGIALAVSSEMVNSLNYECRKWFFSYVEDYLEWVCRKTSSTVFDSQQVAEMMHQIKKVSDWLDLCLKDKSTLEDSELEACIRVRNKIYGILLKHVERTAMSAIVDS
ncbi:hypothetical protein JCGZ_16321 [Jatropha curcas]|uniref:Uncharacterized protein n=2 Tax=Jatropha curcas TaxID=180498 RepID=A0A067LB68_JATCU|nr:hypothetical protein JCGZ_16321 [Jatropha curcas]